MILAFFISFLLYAITAYFYFTFNQQAHGTPGIIIMLTTTFLATVALIIGIIL